MLKKCLFAFCSYINIINLNWKKKNGIMSFHSSGTLWGICQQLATDISGQIIGPIFNSHKVQGKWLLDPWRWDTKVVPKCQ